MENRGEPIGEIAVWMRAGETLGGEQKGLLRTLALQAGVALQNVRLTLELQEQLRELESQAAELSSSRRRLLEARDAEHRRVQGELGRLVAPELEAISRDLDRAGETEDGAPLAGCVADAGEAASRALDALQTLSRGLFPPLLADKGVLPALEAQVRKTAAPASIDADDVVRASRFGPRAEATVYFCCVQALRNALTHAPGSRIALRLRSDDGWLVFSVSDRGPGFDLRSIPEGSGLQTMADRIRALDGELTVDSAPGRGTTIAGRVPNGR